MTAASPRPGALHAAIDRAVVARAALRTRPLRETATALAAAARRWAGDDAWRAPLADEAALSPANVDAAVAIAAAALDADALAALADAEGREGAAPRLVAEVLASNVPALALPAIALGCLAGGATLVKSGRADTSSADAFHAALAAVDPELAATVVTASWRGGDPEGAAVLARADVVVASGHDAAMAALATRLGDRLVANGSRTSVVALGGPARDDVAAAIARDTALHDQRGCLSPTTVWVAGEVAAWAEALVAALVDAARVLPPGRRRSRCARPCARRSPRPSSRARVLAAGPWGAVLTGGTLDLPGARTLHVRPLPSVDALPALLSGVECVGAHGGGLDTEALRARGVARVCLPGRMQRPPIAWPRGQRAPLATLRGRPGAPRILVEAT
ncbi:MAG: hypothetical protein KIT14_05245 [bacterium]|nr:hypothetical protein [bacterium]